MTSDDLANELVATFSDIGDDSLLAFDVANPPESIQIEPLVDDSGYHVLVVPYAEGEESRDRGDMCEETLQCDVYLHGPISQSTKRSDAIALLRVLRSTLRETEYSGFKWRSNETVNGIFDNDVLKTQKYFISMFRATYFNYE